MLLDLVHLLRNLRRSPASAVAAVLTLSLTLGTGASIFAVLDAVVLTPPPFTNPDALVIVGETPIDERTTARRPVSYATFEAWRERAGSLAAIEAFDGTNFTLAGLGTAERVSANYVTPGLLTLLGVRPALGRTFDLHDIGQRVAIVSHAFWRSKLAADPSVIGRQVVLGGQAHTIIGVLPEPFSFALSASDFWVPFPVTAAEAARAGYRVLVVARLARNASAAMLGSALDDVSRTSSPPARVVATSVASAIAGDATTMLAVLAGSATLALLIAFTNLAGLLTVRSIDRRRELAVRTALGARQSEIARQLVLEAETLVAMGIAGGVLLALWMTPAVGRLALEQFGDLANREVSVSWRTIGVIASIATGCAAIAGSLPAFLVARRGVLDVLRRGVTPSPRELILRRVLVTGEIALAFVLLVCLTLLGGSLLRLLDVNPGFEPDGVMTMQVALPAAIYPDSARVVSFYSALQTALAERLGPRSASIANEVPLTGSIGRTRAGLRPADPGSEAVVREIGEAYFDVMRIPLLAGRSFEPHDTSSAPARVVVSESLAGRLFGIESAIGRDVWLSASARTAEIIGIVGEIKHRALDETPSPTVYLSARQSPSRASIVVVRSARSNADVIAAVREEVARLDNDLPVYRTRSMRAVVDASPGVPARRVLTGAFMGFAVLAVALGALGLVGVLAHDVASRRTELALRIALGADPKRIVSATLRQGALMVGAGLMLGSLLSIWAARALSAWLFATDRSDLLGIGAAAAVVVVTGVGAVLPAALRAAHTDPLIALRAE